MGSADWMPRNLDRRVEILFPVLDDTLKEKVKHILDVELADNTKAHVLKPDGEYEKIDRRGKVLVNSQKQFYARRRLRRCQRRIMSTASVYLSQQNRQSRNIAGHMTG